MYFDNLDVVSNTPILVETELTLLTASEGGRTTPVSGCFRPNHNFGDKDNQNYFIGEIFFEEGDFMFPGEKRTVTVRFLNVRGLKDILEVGKEWYIQESATLIGKGLVSSVLKST